MKKLKKMLNEIRFRDDAGNILRLSDITKEYEEVNKEIQEDNEAREKALQKELAIRRAQKVSDRLAETDTPSAVSRFLDNFGYGN